MVPYQTPAAPVEGRGIVSVHPFLPQTAAPGGGMGSWAGMQLGSRGTQKRWRSCCRLFIKTKGFFAFKWCAPTWRLVPGPGGCSRCARTGEVFTAASIADESSPIALCPALPASVGVFFPPQSQCLREDLGGFALFLSTPGDLDHPISWLSPPRERPPRVTMSLAGFFQRCRFPSSSRAGLGVPLLWVGGEALGCVASPRLAQRPLRRGEQMGRWSRGCSGRL